MAAPVASRARRSARSARSRTGAQRSHPRTMIWWRARGVSSRGSRGRRRPYRTSLMDGSHGTPARSRHAQGGRRDGNNGTTSLCQNRPGIGGAPRCPLRRGTADGKPDPGKPYVRFDEGSLRKQVLLYIVTWNGCKGRVYPGPTQGLRVCYGGEVYASHGRIPSEQG